MIILKNVIISIECFRASYKMYCGQRFYTPIKLQKEAFNS